MKKAFLTRLLGAGIGVATLAGCSTLTPDPVPASVREADFGVKSDVKALQEWRQEVRLEQESQAKDVEQLRKQVRELEMAFQELRQTVKVSLQDLEVAREQDKKFIVDELSRKLAGLQAAITPPPPAAGAAKSGYEHIVKPGDSLSKIAGAYKVSMDAILKANSLKSPHSIKVGQKLFIPD
ncbi:MAG: LysM peptidoglycan-binding domain-containing protein [Kiritimatiellia bacterium]